MSVVCWHNIPPQLETPQASSPLFSQIASRWFDILPWQPEEANLDLARATPPPPRARHCTCPPARERMIHQRARDHHLALSRAALGLGPDLSQTTPH